ncbi:sugar phosphate isomerase/epimerase [Candidatus Pacearchaeota archaeon]|nr:sugar phosphate isomerase/epimerase [Candidatus Pacearchaeota archaeon]
MGGDYQFYGGAAYTINPDNDELFQGFSSYRAPAGSFGISTDPRTANQLKAVADKFNTGTKAVEVSAITPNILESIPNQHLEELNKLRKLVGAELTFHGPIVEPTGIGRDGWDEEKRIQAERQMWSAVERGQKINSDGNLVVTFHSSAGLPEIKTRKKTEDGKEQVSEFWVIDEREGKFAPLKIKEDYFKDTTPNAEQTLTKLNKENWDNSLTHASYNAHQSSAILESAIKQVKQLDPQTKLTTDELVNVYAKSRTPEGQKYLNALSPETRKAAGELMSQLNHAENYVRTAYNELQNLYNQAYSAAVLSNNEKDLDKLKAFRAEILPKINKENLEKPDNMAKLNEEIVDGIKTLSTLNDVPKIYKPLNEFAIDKASDTFAGIAYKSYDKFGEKAPIISIENPPAGGALSRGEDLRDLIKSTRKKFEKKLQDDGVSEDEARKIAEKQIGITWDVGHINMIRKFGYDDKDLEKETKKIAPFVKHVHLSDNFGLEHTELPMGMGNVPIKKHMEILDQYAKQAKKIIETGDWYNHFKHSPLAESFAAFGSPIYAMQASPYWSTARGSMSGGYFAGYGLNPDIHHTVYGGGFSTLPVELGGNMSGRSRFSGTPNE